MAIKKPESEGDRLIVDEILRKAYANEEHTIKEMQFAIKHMEYFIDSDRLEQIEKDAKKSGKILEKMCVRVRNYKAWTR